MISLGLDASTRCVGYAFTEDRKILSAGFIDISKVETNRKKAWFVVGEMKKHPLMGKELVINLEASLAGFSGANVVVQLAKWNAVLEYVLTDAFGKEVNLVNVSTVRKFVFGKARIKGMDSKLFVKTELERMYDMTPWQVKNKLGNIDKKVEDTYDAVVISLYTKTVFSKK